MRWTPAHEPIVKTLHGVKVEVGTELKWRGERFVPRGHATRVDGGLGSAVLAVEHVASVEKAASSSLLDVPECYSAEVACAGSPYGHTQWHSAPELFRSLKAAQQWCELAGAASRSGGTGVKEHATFGRGWKVTLPYPGGGVIRHRVMFDHVPGKPGSAHRLPKGHPPWMLSASWVEGRDKWFETLDDAMVWAVNEIAMRETARLG